MQFDWSSEGAGRPDPGNAAVRLFLGFGVRLLEEGGGNSGLNFLFGHYEHCQSECDPPYRELAYLFAVPHRTN